MKHLFRLTQRRLLIPACLAITAVFTLAALLSALTGRDGTLLANKAFAQETAAPAGNDPQPQPHTEAAAELDEPVFESVFPRDPLQSLSLALQDRERRLQQREQELQAREGQLEAIRKEIEENLRKTENTLRQMQQIAGAADRNREDQIVRWVEIYQSMAPDQAGRIIEGLELSFALRILSEMDAKKAGKIINEMTTDKAIEISKQLNQRPI